MRALVGGKVVAVGEVRPYKKSDGSAAASVDVFLAASDPRFKPDRVSMTPELAPVIGEDVTYEATITPKSGQYGPWQSVWCVKRVEVKVTEHKPLHAATG